MLVLLVLATSPSGLNATAAEGDAPPPPPPPGADAPAVPAPSAANPAPPSETKSESEPAAAADPVTGAKLDKVLEARQTGKFEGRPITLQVRDADVTDVLRLISEASGFNIVVGSDVTGKLTISLVDVPWDQALDVVLRTMKLGAERNNNLLRVVTLTELKNEKDQELQTRRAALATIPMITKIFQISYADPSALSSTLSKFIASGPAQGGGAEGGAAAQGQIDVDKRTNSLIVKDIPDNVEKVAKLLAILDTATPQIMVEAKVVEASEDYTHSIGGNLGFGGNGQNAVFASFNGANPLDPLIGTPGVFADGSGVAAGGNAGRFGFSPTISFLPGITRLNAVLNLGESEDQVKVITSPKVVVLNKQTANVTQGIPVAIPSQTISNGVVTNSVTVSTANISLNVTPSVTNDGSVEMTLALQRDVPQTIQGGGQASATRNLNTRVLVDSGSTLVIGGMYTMQVNHGSSGFPILRDIPILGFLFGQKQESSVRSELFFFITPRILNAKEAGIAG